MRRTGATALLLATVATVAACAPAPPCGLRRCDVREAACQQALSAAAACLRQVPPVDVPVTLVARETLLAEAAAAAAQPRDLTVFNHLMRGLALLKLAPVEVSPGQAAYLDSAWIGAWYSFTQKSITIVDAGRPLDSLEMIALLIHEYAHALQGENPAVAAFNLRPTATTDAWLAGRAMLEGEAVLVEDLALLGMLGVAEEGVDWPDIFGKWHTSALAVAARSPLPVLEAQSHFPYPFGTAYVHGVYRGGGLPAVADHYAHAPTSSRQVLAGAAAAEPAGGPWTEDLGPEAIPLLPPAYQLVLTDQLGAWLLRVFMQRLADADTPQPFTPVPAAVASLRADVMSIFKHTSTDSTVLAWRLRFATHDVAAQLAAALRGRGPWVVSQRERDIVVLAAQGDELDSLPSNPMFMPVPPAPTPMPPAPAPSPMACPVRSAGSVSPFR